MFSRGIVSCALIMIISICGFWQIGVEVGAYRNQLTSAESTISKQEKNIGSLEQKVKDGKAQISEQGALLKKKDVAIEKLQSDLKEANAEIESLKKVSAPASNAATAKPKTSTASSGGNFGSFKSYTDYTLLSRSSAQWKLQEKAYTDENGLRKIGNAYLVAMGSYYGTTLGNTYHVVMNSGSEFDVMLCDCKSDVHTDANNRVCLVNGSVIEFYVDSDLLPSSVKVSGSVGSIPGFEGGIASIAKL